MKKLFQVDLKWFVASITALALTALFFAGCFWRKDEYQPAFTVRPPNAQTNVMITPANSPVGRIASINKPGNFAVINFPIGQVPANGTMLSIFHAGQKVGAIKISGPAADSFTVGDITIGTAQEGDEVRAE